VRNTALLLFSLKHQTRWLYVGYYLVVDTLFSLLDLFLFFFLNISSSWFFFNPLLSASMSHWLSALNNNGFASTFLPCHSFLRFFRNPSKFLWIEWWWAHFSLFLRSFSISRIAVPLSRFPALRHLYSSVKPIFLKKWSHATITTRFFLKWMYVVFCRRNPDPRLKLIPPSPRHLSYWTPHLTKIANERWLSSTTPSNWTNLFDRLGNMKIILVIFLNSVIGMLLLSFYRSIRSLFTLRFLAPFFHWNSQNIQHIHVHRHIHASHTSTLNTKGIFSYIRCLPLLLRLRLLLMISFSISWFGILGESVRVD
jgi:hypothetical protein